MIIVPSPLGAYMSPYNNYQQYKVWSIMQSIHHQKYTLMQLLYSKHRLNNVQIAYIVDLTYSLIFQHLT